MKRFIIVFIILILTNNYSFANAIDEIESSRLNCLNINNQSDFVMAECNYQAINLYNKEINEELKLLKKILNNDKYKLLSDANLSWEVYIKNNNLLLNNLFENQKFAEPYLISSSIKCQNSKQYLEKLITIRKYLSEIKK